MIINSDAVYLTKKNKHMILIQAFISILWKLIMLYCLRFGYFMNMHPRKMFTLMIDNTETINYTTSNNYTSINGTNSTINSITTGSVTTGSVTTGSVTTGSVKEFYLNNISVYAGKTSSMIILLMGQIIFRYRHPEQAYALRTHYTVKSNREWNEMNRNNRIQKNKNLKSHVNDTRDFLESIVI